MITYFEYSAHIVALGYARAPLCCTIGKIHKSIKITAPAMAMAERVYQIEGNELTEIKNRSGVCSTMHISEEDKLVLRLRAVLLN